MRGLGLVLQVALLITWYTVLPGLPVWVVFLPLIIGVSTIAFVCVWFVFALILAILGVK